MFTFVVILSELEVSAYLFNRSIYEYMHLCDKFFLSKYGSSEINAYVFKTSILDVNEILRCIGPVEVVESEDSTFKVNHLPPVTLREH